MSSSRRSRSFSLGHKLSEEENGNMLEVFRAEMREKIVLQRLVVVARLPRGLTDRTEPGAHYEKLNFQLSKQFIWDPLSGLLLVYPSCLLHVIESSREVLAAVLKDLKDMQQHPDGAVLEAPKVVFMDHDPRSRLFPQWSYKVLDADQRPGDSAAKGLEEEEETETLVCTVLSALQRLGGHLETSKKAVPGSVLDEAPDLIVPPEILHKLLSRAELLTPQQHLQTYDAPRHVGMEFGKRRKMDVYFLKHQS